MDASVRIPPVRIAPLPEAERTAEIRRLLLLATKTPREVHLYSTVVRHQVLYERWLGLAHGVGFDGSLPVRVRELVILRTAIQAKCRYEWAQHERIARRNGVTDEEITAVRRGPDDPFWTEDDAMLLLAVDEAEAEATISERTWSRLCSRWSERELIELTVLIGTYRLTALMINAFGVALDPGLNSDPGSFPDLGSGNDVAHPAVGDEAVHKAGSPR